MDASEPQAAPATERPSSSASSDDHNPPTGATASSDASSVAAGPAAGDATTAATSSPAAAVLQPAPTRPWLPNRKSSGTIIVPRDSKEANRPVDNALDPTDVRAMSPRRTSQDLEQLGRQTRDEMRQHAQKLQESLLLIFHRIQAVKEEHDKLDSNNKFLQKYIGDLMTTSKITATGGGRGKK